MASPTSMVASLISRTSSASTLAIAKTFFVRETVYLTRGSNYAPVFCSRHPVRSLCHVQSRNLFPNLDRTCTTRRSPYVNQTVITWAFNSTDAKDTNPDQSAKVEDAAKELSETEKKLQEENGELREKHEDLMDKYRRSLAESDNMRKRLTKQIDDAKLFGIQGFCKDLLEVADVLGKAIESVPEESLAASQHVRDMFEGLKLTQTQLHQVFKRHGLEQDDPINQKFDPNRHEALFQIPAPDKEPNLVMDVQKVGYLLHGRTIRPALVGVSKKP